MIQRSRGIRPYTIIEPEYGEPIWQASLPHIALVPLLQHQGEEAVPLVRPGDQVREGLLIGNSRDDRGAGVHAPIPGEVDSIVDMQLPDGQTCKAVKIRLRGQFDYLGKAREPLEWQSLSPLALIELVREKGIVHMDGFTEPLSRTLTDLRNNGAPTLVINAASGSPFVANEIRLLVEQPESIVQGIEVLQKVIGNRDCQLALNVRHARLARPFLELLRERGIHVKIRKVPDRYPAGDPYELIFLATGQRLLPQADISESRAGVFAVSTIFAVFEAVVLRKALVDRLITIGGGALGVSRTVRVRIGTALSAVFEEVGGLKELPAKILVGNPLQGYDVSNVNMPVTKQVTTVIALREEELGVEPEMPCISCGICVDQCPADLEPVTLHKLLRRDRLDEALEYGLMACRVCGICSHVCPSHIPLTTILRDGIVRLTEDTGHDK